MADVRTTVQEPRRGTFPNGMEYLTWGDGPRTLLSILGGPGSFVPTGTMARMLVRQSRPYVAAGYTNWIVTRRRDMPADHGIADMADDYAQLVTEEFGGRVDLVVAESFGGMIAQYLAARHPNGPPAWCRTPAVWRRPPSATTWSNGWSAKRLRLPRAGTRRRLPSTLARVMVACRASWVSSHHGSWR